MSTQIAIVLRAGAEGCFETLNSHWPAGAGEALLRVPSVVVSEEDNVPIDPTHSEAERLVATKVRKFVYDPRV